MSDQPPPPPPHGGPGGARSGGLPPGKYDIFVIPEHSAGSGFIYLPSLQPNINSFVAGFASALILVVLGQSMAPAFRTWWESFQGLGNVGVAMLIMGVGFGAWALGRQQQDGGGFASNFSKPKPNASSGGPGGSAGYGGAHPGAAPHADGPPPPPPPHGSRSGDDYGHSRQGGPPPHGTRHNANSYQSSGSPPPPPRGDPPPTPPPQSSPPPPKEEPRSPPPKPQPPPQPQPEPKKPEAKKPEEKKPEPKKADPPPKSAWEKARDQYKGTWEKAREETRKKEEERKAKEAEQKRREETAKRLAELRAKEAKERQAREVEKQKKEKEAKEKEDRLKAEQRTKELLEKLEREKKERERLQKEAKEKEEKLKKELEEQKNKEEAQKKKQQEEELKKKEEEQKKKEAEEAKSRASGSYSFSGKGEKMSMWPNGRPPSVSNHSPTPSMASKNTARGPSPEKKPPSSAKSFMSEDTYSYRPYDKPKKAASRRRSGSSFASESSFAPSQTTARTSPPPSMRGVYTTKDPDKIVISGVYLFMNQFAKTPASQLISGVGTVTDGLILRITTEGLFIDDDVRSVPQREWDVKAWTLKQIETGEWKSEGLHIVRATIKDQENKRYLFVIDEDEHWKVVAGLQRLRKGAQVRQLGRQLGVTAMPPAEAKAALESLGWGP